MFHPVISAVFATSVFTSLMFSCGINFFHRNMSFVCLSPKLTLSLLVFYVCSPYIGNLTNARSATRYSWTEVLVTELIVQKIPVHLSAIITHYQAFQRHALQLPYFRGYLLLCGMYMGATHAIVCWASPCMFSFLIVLFHQHLLL
jgi:hypothetical protein